MKERTVMQGKGEAEAEYPIKVLTDIFCDVDLVDKTIFEFKFFITDRVVSGCWRSKCRTSGVD